MLNLATIWKPQESHSRPGLDLYRQDKNCVSFHDSRLQGNRASLDCEQVHTEKVVNLKQLSML